MESKDYCTYSIATLYAQYKVFVETFMFVDSQTVEVVFKLTLDLRYIVFSQVLGMLTKLLRRSKNFRSKVHSC